MRSESWTQSRKRGSDFNVVNNIFTRRDLTRGILALSALVLICTYSYKHLFSSNRGSFQLQQGNNGKPSLSIPIQTSVEPLTGKQTILELRSRQIDLVDDAILKAHARNILFSAAEEALGWNLLGKKIFASSNLEDQSSMYGLVNPLLLLAPIVAATSSVNEQSIKEATLSLRDLSYVPDTNSGSVIVNISGASHKFDGVSAPKPVITVASFNAYELGFKFVSANSEKSRNIEFSSSFKYPLNTLTLFGVTACRQGLESSRCNGPLIPGSAAILQVRNYPALASFDLWNESQDPLIDPPAFTFNLHLTST